MPRNVELLAHLAIFVKKLFNSQYKENQRDDYRLWSKIWIIQKISIEFTKKMSTTSLLFMQPKVFYSQQFQSFLFCKSFILSISAFLYAQLVRISFSKHQKQIMILYFSQFMLNKGNSYICKSLDQYISRLYRHQSTAAAVPQHVIKLRNPR